MFQGKIHEAGEAIESFIKQHPRDWEGLFLQGEILSSQREYLKALKVYETLEIMDPQHLAPKNRKITLLLEMGALHLAAREMHQIGASIDPAIQHKAAGDDAVKWIHWKFPEKARTHLMQNIHILESKISPQWLAQKTGNDSLPLGPILVFLDHITESEGQGVWDTDKGRHYLRAIWDLIMAYDSEQRWNDMVLLYEAMEQRGHHVPAWVQGTIASAYLVLQRPQKALRLYQGLVQDPPEFQSEMGMIYTLTDLRQFDEAHKRLENLDQITPVQKWTRGLYEKNWEKSDILIYKAWFLMHQGRLKEAETHLNDLMKRASFNTNLRNAVAHLHLWRGQLRRALEEFKIIHTIDPEHKVAHNGYAIALHRMGYVQKANEILNQMTALYPNEILFKKTKQLFELSKKRTLIIDGSSALENHGSDDYLLSVYADHPLTHSAKLFYNLIYRLTEQKENKDVLRRMYYGTDLFKGEQWKVRGAVSTDYDISENPGFFIDGSHSPNDWLKLTGRYENRIFNLPLRSREQGVRANEVQASAAIQPHELFTTSIGGNLRHYSDGNNEGSFIVKTDRALWTRANWKIRSGTEWFGSYSSKKNVSYFSPTFLYSGQVNLKVEHIWYERYEKRWLERWAGGFALQKQRKISLHDTWFAQYEQEFQFNQRMAIAAGLRFALRNYDGEDVSELDGFFRLRLLM